MIRRFLIVILLFFCSSCALFFNDNRSVLTIESDPPEAEVLIEGRNYGRTPIRIDLKPGKYDVSLIKEGYGSANFKTDLVQGIEKGSDGTRCLFDAVGSIFVLTFYSAFFSEKCAVFKENYNVKIPFTASDAVNNRRGSRVYDNNYNRHDAYPPIVRNKKSTSPYDNYSNDHKGQKSNADSYDENDLFIRQGYGRSLRLPVYKK